MIVREATADDLPALKRLCNRVWRQLAMPWRTTVSRLRALQKQRFRIIVLYDGNVMLAALTAHPLETDRGPGYHVPMFAVDQKHPERLSLLDALSLYACNIAASEGRTVVVSTSLKSVPGPAYGREYVGMEATDKGDSYHQVGTTRTIIQTILERHPEWQLL